MYAFADPLESSGRVVRQVYYTRDHPAGILGHEGQRRPRSRLFVESLSRHRSLLTFFLADISSFLRLRRFESMTVHTFLQKFCIADCAWLLPPSASESRNSEQRPNELEMAKRGELLQEFIFWIVDGLIIPLVRVSFLRLAARRAELISSAQTAFYITDSATHQNRPLFFRQDDWERLCAPLLGTLGKTIFERIPAVSRPFSIAERLC